MIFEWSTKAKHGDAFDAWRNDIMLDSTPWAVGSKPTGPFTASHKFLALNGLPMGEVTISGASGHRTAREIRASTVENYTCVVMVSGSQGVSQEQFNRKVSPGEIYLWDSELPCSFECRAKTSQIQISIPKEQIHRVTGGRHLSPNVISSTSGIGAILAQFMATAMKNVTEFSMDQNDRVSEVAMNLILGGFDRQGRPQGNTPRLVALKHIQIYIDKNLRDPQLTPAKVAAANGVSVRYLYLLFAQSPTTFSTYLNDQRIIKIQAELQKRSVSNVTLTQLAFHYGFSSSAQLSRVFKRMSGQSPRTYRKKYHSKPSSRVSVK